MQPYHITITSLDAARSLTTTLLSAIISSTRHITSSLHCCWSLFHHFINYVSNHYIIYSGMASSSCSTATAGFGVGKDITSIHISMLNTLQNAHINGPDIELIEIEMHRPKQNISALWIEHQRRNTKRTKRWACIYCADRKIFYSESDLRTHQQNSHQSKLPDTPEEFKLPRNSNEVNPVLRDPTRSCEEGHLHNGETTEDRPHKKTVEGRGISADLAPPSREHSEIPLPRRSLTCFQLEQLEIYSQGEARPRIQEELVAEVKGIYAGLVMVEARPEVDEGSWQALVKMLL